MNNQKYLNKYCEVLVENKLQDQTNFFGRTKFMIPVIIESGSCKPGEIINVKISSFDKRKLFGLHENNKIKAA